ncbi:hypothetical protein K2173_016621 [Erythroxylum novogranatense]|uniref:F-box domain-containing protein n=1 Tax=Erythroxylum novogranatense TaxID=1862640 RepID=A0AAV8SGN7_9ROSI|nr:hypothetical protein K2173_016621 [Erythroxylum novogranatense]
MSESCNSRHFSWLVKSCLPNSQDTTNALTPIPLHSPTTTAPTTLSALPDDLLLECLSRVPSSSLPSLSLVCRRWSHIVHSSTFVSLRRIRHFHSSTLFALSSSDSVLFTASLNFKHNDHSTTHDDSNILGDWKVSTFITLQAPSLIDNLSHARLSSIGPRIYIVERHGVLCYDTWTHSLTLRSSMNFRRKKFACAVVSSKIYVAGGGGSRAPAALVEEYDPERDTWSVVAHAPRRRFGCIGAAVDGVFYVIGGLKIGGASETEVPRAAATGTEYASTMDLYDVKTRAWLRSRTVPGGGCAVAACATAAGFVYVLASHAVEMSFWRFDGRRQNGGAGFGEWTRIKSPPLPPQVRVDSTVRFSCVASEEKVVVVQVNGCIDDLLRRSGRNRRGMREGLVLVYDTVGGEWSRGPDLPEVIRRAACVSVEC